MSVTNALVDYIALDYAVFGESVTYSNFDPYFVESWTEAKDLHIAEIYGEATKRKAKKAAKKVKKSKAKARKILEAAKKKAVAKRKVAKKKMKAKKAATKKAVKEMASIFVTESACTATEAVDVAANLALTEYVIESFNPFFAGKELLTLATREMIG